MVAESNAWCSSTKIAFRFTFAYFVLYNIPFPLTMLPYVDSIATPYEDLWNTIVVWVGAHVMHLAEPITIRPGGSGDTTWSYVQNACFVAFAAVATIVWSPLDRKRGDYRTLFAWLHAYVRLVLATTLISYGAVKVIQSQFPQPSLGHLLEPFGRQSPMGLLWAFMGSSGPYNVFAGAAEMLGGLLLLSRRTTLVGALVSFGALSNVVMLNFAYDVPVKLYSLNLLAMAAFLALPDVPRLVALFVTNRRVEPAPVRTLFTGRWQHRTALAVRTLFLLGFAAWSLVQAQESRHTYGELAPKPLLHGIWEVDELVVDGQARPPLTTDAERWRRVTFESQNWMEAQFMNDEIVYMPCQLDESSKTMSLTDPKRTGTWKLTFERTDPTHLVLDGEFEGKPLHAALHRIDESQFLLRSRGFHWINEFPFNR